MRLDIDLNTNTQILGTDVASFEQVMIVENISHKITVEVRDENTVSPDPQHTVRDENTVGPDPDFENDVT